jgi:hypothetical protein
MAEGTRSKTEIWLIGQEERQILGSKVPSIRQALSLFFYHHRTQEQTIRVSSTAVVKVVEKFWKKARPEVRQKQHSVTKLEQLFHIWGALKKNANRKTGTQIANEKTFVDLDNLFDIACMDVLRKCTIEEDRQFLLAQREPGRCGCMGSVDKALGLKEARTIKRKQAALKYRHHYEQKQKDLLKSESGKIAADDDSRTESSSHGS